MISRRRGAARCGRRSTSSSPSASEGAIGVSDDVYGGSRTRRSGNPIGAGDAFSAALALALTTTRPSTRR